MKMVRIVLIVALVVIVSAGAYAQNTFFPTQAGTVTTYAHKDARGRVESHTRQTVKSVEGSGSNMTISYVFEMLDRNQKPQKTPVELPLTVIVKDDVMILDMNQMFAGQLKDAQLKMEITGVPMELPGNLQPGQTLKDANMTMTVNMGIMKMSTNIKMTDGQCLAIEDVTVEAGTFRSHKITQTVTANVMKVNTVSKTVAWYAPGIGTVKTETYDNRDRLQNTVELISLTKGNTD